MDKSNSLESNTLESSSPSESPSNGDFEYLPAWLSEASAKHLFADLMANLCWQQPSITLYGKQHPIPRLQAWLGDRPHKYRYSGQDFIADIWPDSVADIARDISAETGVLMNSVLVNLYRDGQDSMGWHADDEPELGPDPVIASLSLGATRDFALRRTGTTRQAGRIALSDGSLLVMKAGMQSRWQHALPKRARVKLPRINLTFRQIIV
ncbi:MAG: alpha-ketoglutarate-dependent dioxygenase AlkB [Pseudomonadota bacterium]|nr:alpha-ketoglutarate-dependent dioxygenase AlkB [Pseudomonadota bacterium]MEE2748682.1 alpha-ketoglutarate-dependent dioxygenase AlkB [Pseudomonadota bacterium]